MLNAHTPAWGAADDAVPEEVADRPDRTSGQYTLKGVDPESIDLMRAAARREGMKIGAWVSARMREAAQRSLAVAGQGSDTQAWSVPLDAERLRRIEEEVAEIAKAQRAIMARMLSETR